jgi:hypothetical protein
LHPLLCTKHKLVLVVLIFVVLVWLDVTPFNLRGIYHLHLQGRRRWKQQVFQKYQYPSIVLHGITYHKTVIFKP